MPRVDKITLEMNRRTSLLTSGLAASVNGESSGSKLPDVLRAPDAVAVYLEKGRVALKRTGARWTGAAIKIVAEARATAKGGELPISLTAPSDAVMKVGLRWKGIVPASRIVWCHLSNERTN